MIILDRDGSLWWHGSVEASAAESRETVELPMTILEQQCNVIDRVLTFAFDVLGLQAVELRVREEQQRQ